MTNRRSHRLASLTVSAAAVVTIGTLLAGCADQSSDAPEPNPRVGEVEAVSPALARYETDQVQALWEDQSLSARDRGLATVAALVAGGQTSDLGFYVDKALDDGVTPAEISEAITHLAFYSGWPNALAAVDRVAAVFEARGIDESELPQSEPVLLPQDEAAEATRERTVQEQHGGTSQHLVDDTDEVVFDDLWLRPDLAPRDRSLITVVALVASAQSDQISFHLGRAMDNGLTAGDVDPLMNHLAYFTGWPKVFTAMPIVIETLESR